MTTPAEIREDLVRALRLDLVGPGREDDDLAREVLPQAPSRWYLTGFLVPYEAPAAAAHHPTHRKRDRLSRPGGRVCLSARLLRRAAQADACRAPLRDGNRACERSRTHLPQEGLATKRCLSYLCASRCTCAAAEARAGVRGAARRSPGGRRLPRGSPVSGAPFPIPRGPLRPARSPLPGRAARGPRGAAAGSRSGDARASRARSTGPSPEQPQTRQPGPGQRAEAGTDPEGPRLVAEDDLVCPGTDPHAAKQAVRPHHLHGRPVDPGHPAGIHHLAQNQPGGEARAAGSRRASRPERGCHASGPPSVAARSGPRTRHGGVRRCRTRIERGGNVEPTGPGRSRWSWTARSRSPSPCAPQRGDSARFRSRRLGLRYRLPVATDAHGLTEVVPWHARRSPTRSSSRS
jgi:hypothetical protein